MPSDEAVVSWRCCRESSQTSGMGASCVRSDGCTDKPTAKRMMKSRFDCHVLSISSTDIGQALSAIDEDKAPCLWFTEYPYLVPVDGSSRGCLRCSDCRPTRGGAAGGEGDWVRVGVGRGGEGIA